MSEPRFLRASRLIAAVQAPVVVPQARRLRRSTVHLPDAALPWEGEFAGPVRAGVRALRLLVLGDSTAAGVGVDSQIDGLPGRLAITLAERLGRGVAWRAVGENGATTHDLLERFVGEAFIEPFDLLFLSIGANDALGVRSAAAYARDLRRILNLASRAQPDATVLVSSMPLFGDFDLLPEPLRGALFRHARNLERAGRAVTATDPRWIMSSQPPPYAEGFFADDEFHPSATGYRDWADWAVDDAWHRGLQHLEDVES
jgi:lysophospholipase L1-like esterase